MLKRKAHHPPPNPGPTCIYPCVNTLYCLKRYKRRSFRDLHTWMDSQARAGELNDASSVHHHHQINHNDASPPSSDGVQELLPIPPTVIRQVRDNVNPHLELELELDFDQKKSSLLCLLLGAFGVSGLLAYQRMYMECTHGNLVITCKRHANRPVR